MIVPVGSIFCDEVRQEINGKLLFIGVYSGDYLVNSFPYTAGITPILLLTSSKSGKYKANVQLATVNGAVFVNADIEIQNGQAKQIVEIVPLPPVAIALSGPDTLELKISIEDQAPLTIGQISIKKI